MHTVKDRLQQLAAEFEPELEAALGAAGDVPPRLSEAMSYAVLGGGKRLRPALVMTTARLCGGADAWAWPAAVAVEMVHGYSLVHDDLPCMDDDDLRRGRPTVHKVWGDAMAVLAADALQTLAFETLARSVAPPERRIEAVRVLARAAGADGMVGGQVLDLEAEGEVPSLESVERIHRKKTAALLAASVDLGSVIGGAPEPDRRWLREFGTKLGLAFQIVDDCLDETATSDELGKTAGKDREAHKATWPACIGTKASMEQARRLVAGAREALHRAKGLDLPRRFLDDLSSFVVDRRL